MLKLAMKRIHNKTVPAQGGAINFFIGAMIATVIALSVAWPVMDSALQGNAAASTADLTWSGNFTDADFVNITLAGVPYRFEFNVTTGSTAIATGSIEIPMNTVHNSSTIAATNVSSYINNNATLAAVLTAANHSTGVVRLTYDTTGYAGNQVGLAESSANAVWSSANMTGGRTSSMDNMSAPAQTLSNQLPLFLVLVLLMVFVKALV